MPSTILVVDDNEIHAYAMRKMLESEGFGVTEAHTGNEAVQLTLHQHPDVVLLDVNLPDIDGFAVCRSLRQRDQNLPAIVFHTATSATETSHRKAMDEGATAFLTYPVPRDQLLAVIALSIARSRQQNSH